MITNLLLLLVAFGDSNKFQLGARHYIENEGAWYTNYGTPPGQQGVVVHLDRILIKTGSETMVDQPYLDLQGFNVTLQPMKLPADYHVVLVDDGGSEGKGSVDPFVEAQALLNDPAIEDVLFSFDVVLSDCTFTPPPNDPWWLTAPACDTGQPLGQWNMSLINIDDVWQSYASGDPSVTVAVIDNGTLYTHSDLIENIWVNDGEDLNNNGVFDFEPPPNGDLDEVDNDLNGFEDDLVGWNFAGGGVNGTNTPLPVGVIQPHGTGVAGLVAARTYNGVGVAGVAGGCKSETCVKLGCGSGTKVMVIRTLLTVEGLGQSMLYAAENGADILNMSLGVSVDDACLLAMVRDVTQNYGTLVVAASGNGDFGASIDYPAGYGETLAVTSVTHNGTPYPDRKDGRHSVSAPRRVYSTSRDSSLNESYGCFSGTSFSTPQAAGVASIARFLAPTMSPKTLLFLFNATAYKPMYMAGEYYSCRLGYGILDALGLMDELVNPTIMVSKTLLNYNPSGPELVLARNAITAGGSYTLPSSTERIMHAGNRVTLSPGFHAVQGSDLKVDVGYHECVD